MSQLAPRSAVPHPRPPTIRGATGSLALFAIAHRVARGSRSSSRGIAHVTRFENRPMAPWPKPALSREFPPAFDRAFSDRFGGRDTLVRLHHGGLLRVFGVSSLATVMVGHDGWYYWLGEDGHSLDRHYRGTMDVSARAKSTAR